MYKEGFIKATTTGKILFLMPQVVTSNISSLINKSLYDGVRISLGTRTGGLNDNLGVRRGNYFQALLATLQIILRMHCIDRPRVSESNVLCISILSWLVEPQELPLLNINTMAPVSMQYILKMTDPLCDILRHLNCKYFHLYLMSWHTRYKIIYFI